MLHRRFKHELLRQGDEDVGDSRVLGRGSGVVGVVFYAKVVAELDFFRFDNLENAAGGFGKIGVGPGQDEAAVFAPVKFFVTHAFR